MSRVKVTPRRRALQIVFRAVFVLAGCSPAPDPNQDPDALRLTLAVTWGYPAATSRLTLRLEDDLQKLCHATLVSPGWALTAAHCFGGVEPAARGTLNEFARNLAVSDVIFHPAALASGATRLEQLHETSDFVAAHDLALIPISPTVDDIAPVPRWLASETCTLPDRFDVRARFGKFGPRDEAQTVEADLLGIVSAASLLGRGQSGSLLSAQGPSVGPGDSGSGVTVADDQLDAIASGCEHSAGARNDIVLMGVIQDANVEQSTQPFGLVALHFFEHSQWLTEVLESTPPRSEPERPRLYP